MSTPLYQKCEACAGTGRMPSGDDDCQGRKCIRCNGVGYWEVGVTVGQLDRLVEQSLTWYEADGSSRRLYSPEEVIKRRKEAAAELVVLRREVEDLRARCGGYVATIERLGSELQAVVDSRTDVVRALEELRAEAEEYQETGEDD